MKQFNLDTWLKDKSRKVVTITGKSVRIICTDAKGKLPIIALVPFGDSEDAYHYNKNGVANGFESITLFFADEEEELTEFEKKLQIIISEASHWISDDGSISTYCQFGDKEIKKISGQILDLARKEILKDLPKWKKGTPPSATTLYVIRRGYYLPIKEVDNIFEILPKEE